MHWHVREYDRQTTVFGADGVLDGYFDAVQGDERGTRRGRIHRFDGFSVDAFATFDQYDSDPVLSIHYIRSVP